MIVLIIAVLFCPRPAKTLDSGDSLFAVCLYRVLDPREGLPFTRGEKRGLCYAASEQAVRTACEKAQAHGISAFAVDFFWSQDVRFSNPTPEEFRTGEGLAIPYCLNWKTDGPGEICGSEIDALYSSLCRHTDSENYFSVGGRPVLLIETAAEPQELHAAVAGVKSRSERDGRSQPFVVYGALSKFQGDPPAAGFDGTTRLLPHLAFDDEPRLLVGGEPGIYSYSALVGMLHKWNEIANGSSEHLTACAAFEGCVPGTRFRYAHGSPDLFQSWLQRALATCFSPVSPEAPLAFIRSWQSLTDEYLARVLPAKRRALEVRALWAEDWSNPILEEYEAIRKVQASNMAAYAADHPDKKPILLYQMGKVGSTTIFRALRAASPERFVLSLHSLVNLQWSIAQAATRMPDAKEAVLPNVKGMVTKAWLDSLDDGVRPQVITMVRDPIAMDISRFFQMIESIWPEFRERLSRGDVTVDEVVQTFLGAARHKRCCAWFADNFEPVFPIDLASLPYEHGKGYAIAEGAGGRFRVMVMRSEDITRVGSAACREFLGIELGDWKSENTASNKFYSEIYREFKKQPLPRWYVDWMLDDAVIRNFYSAEEVEGMARKYTHDAG